MEYIITKTSVDCYKIRSVSGGYWADITIDCKDNTGRIQIASDFGSWQNYWNACGCPFKEFLARLNIHYFAGKVGASDWFDFDKTIIGYKQHVLGERRIGLIEATEAREMFNEIKMLDENGESFFEVTMWNECPSLMREFNQCPDTRKDIHPLFRKFWEIIWPEFIKEIKSEISITTPL